MDWMDGFLVNKSLISDIVVIKMMKDPLQDPIIVGLS